MAENWFKTTSLLVGAVMCTALGATPAPSTSGTPATAPAASAPAHSAHADKNSDIPPDFSPVARPSTVEVSPELIKAIGKIPAVTTPVIINAADGLDLSSPIEILGDDDTSDVIKNGRADERTCMGSDRDDGAGLLGTLYDLKQTSRGEATPVAEDPANGASEAIRQFLAQNWNQSVFAGCFRARTKLSATSFYLPELSAEYAPFAFGCADKVKPTGYVVLYRGKVRAPKSGTFRFVGGGDEVLAVRFNYKTVLEWGYEVPSFGFSGNRKRGKATFNEGLARMRARGYGNVVRYKKGDVPGAPNADGFVRFCDEVGLIEGIPFEVKEGRVYPIEIMVAQLHGGAIGYYLFIEEMEGTCPKTASGEKIYQIFRTTFVNPDHRKIMDLVKRANRKSGKTFNKGWGNDKLEGLPFDGDSWVWSAIP